MPGGGAPRRGCWASFWEGRGAGLCVGASPAGRVHAAPMPCAGPPTSSHPGSIPCSSTPRTQTCNARETGRAPSTSSGVHSQRRRDALNRQWAAHGTHGDSRAGIASLWRTGDAAAALEATSWGALLRRRHNRHGDACAPSAHRLATLPSDAAVLSGSGCWARRGRRRPAAAAATLARRPPRLRSRRRGLPAAGHPGGDGQRRRAAAPAGEPRAS